MNRRGNRQKNSHIRDEQMGDDRLMGQVEEEEEQKIEFSEEVPDFYVDSDDSHIFGSEKSFDIMSPLNISIQSIEKVGNEENKVDSFVGSDDDQIHDITQNTTFQSSQSFEAMNTEIKKNLFLLSKSIDILDKQLSNEKLMLEKQDFLTQLEDCFRSFKFNYQEMKKCDTKTKGSRIKQTDVFFNRAISFLVTRLTSKQLNKAEFKPIQIENQFCKSIMSQVIYYFPIAHNYFVESILRELVSHVKTCLAEIDKDIIIYASDKTTIKDPKQKYVNLTLNGGHFNVTLTAGQPESYYEQHSHQIIDIYGELTSDNKLELMIQFLIYWGKKRNLFESGIISEKALKILAIYFLQDESLKVIADPKQQMFDLKKLNDLIGKKQKGFQLNGPFVCDMIQFRRQIVTRKPTNYLTDRGEIRQLNEYQQKTIPIVYIDNARILQEIQQQHKGCKRNVDGLGILIYHFFKLIEIGLNDSVPVVITHFGERYYNTQQIELSDQIGIYIVDPFNFYQNLTPQLRGQSQRYQCFRDEIKRVYKLIEQGKISEICEQFKMQREFKSYP